MVWEGFGEGFVWRLWAGVLEEETYKNLIRSLYFLLYSVCFPFILALSLSLSLSRERQVPLGTCREPKSFHGFHIFS